MARRRVPNRPLCDANDEDDCARQIALARTQLRQRRRPRGWRPQIVPSRHDIGGKTGGLALAEAKQAHTIVHSARTETFEPADEMPVR